MQLSFSLACLLVSQVALPLFPTAVATPRGTRRPWMTPCFDYRDVESDALADMLPSLHSLPGSSAEDLDLLADRLAARLSDTVSLIHDILVHIRQLYGGNEDHVQRLDSSDPIHQLRPSTRIATEDDEIRALQIVARVYEALSRIAVFVDHLRRRGQQRDPPQILSSYLRMLEHGGQWRQRINMGGIYPILCEIYMAIPSHAIPRVNLDILPTSITDGESLAEQRDNSYRVLTTAKDTLEQIRQELLASQ